MTVFTIGEIKRELYDLFKVDNALPSFICGMNKKEFKKKSYYIWAVDQLFQYILKNGRFDGRFITWRNLKEVVENHLGESHELVEHLRTGQSCFPIALYMEDISFNYLDYLNAIGG